MLRRHFAFVGRVALVSTLLCAVAGDFTHEDDGSRWVMIVNKNLKESAFCRPKFRATPTSVRYLSPVTGELKKFPSPWYALAPGQGVLLKVN